MYLPDPPCCKIRGAAGCNESGICSKVGGFGYDFFDKNRGWIFIVLAFMSVAVTVISIIPIVSMSHNSGDVKNTYWTKGEYDSTEFFIGLEKVVFSVGDQDDSFLWEDDKCDLLLSSSGSDSCNECKSACKGVVKVVILNIIIIASTIISNTKRSTVEGDLNCTKLMAIFSGFVSSIVMLSSVSIFSNGCFDNLPEESDSGQSITYTRGPAFWCVIVPQIFKVTEAIIHVVTPVPPRSLSGNKDLKQPLYDDSDGHLM